jgi:HMG (high mobility group) box
MRKRGYVTLAHDQLLVVVVNEQHTVELIHLLTDQTTQLIHAVASSSHDRDSLAKTYQKVIVALATLQTSVQDLSKAYINHANTVLNPGRAGTLDLNLTTTLLDSGLLTHRIPSPGMKQEAPAEAKKKRKRAAHDPHAPKRALTPYFLYMQSARPQIAKELGSNAKPKEVADEGTRRWTIMPEADKNVVQPSLAYFCLHANMLSRFGTLHIKRILPSTVSRQLPTRLARLFQMMTRLRRLLKLTQPSRLHQSRRKKKRKKSKRKLRWLKRRATPSHPLSQLEPLLHPSQGRGVRLGRSQL